MLERFFFKDTLNFEKIKKGFEIANILINEFDADQTLYITTIVEQILDEKEFDELVNFDDNVKILFKSIKKIKNLPKDKIKQHTDNFIKLILTSVDDIRAIFILIAEHLYFIRNIEQFSENYKKIILKQIKYLYLPITHRLGLYKIKKEFEEELLRIQYPEIYYEIERKIKKLHHALNSYIQNFINEVKKIIKPLGYKYTIKGRIKSVSSIWRKMQRKNIDFEEVFDIFAIRIILDVPEENEIPACWEVFSAIIDKYPHYPARLRDWLTIPKSNGYMSLHMTVLGPQNKWIEIQIRSKKMDQIAESGIAAHWKYKEYSKNDINRESLFEQIRKALQTPVISKKKPEIFTTEIYVFTPQKDLIKLPKGATVLDFAYTIHSELGNHCVGAFINDKFVSYYHKLKNGDTIKIITDKQQKPKREWLTLVKSQRAKRKIKQYLVQQQYKWIQIGRESLQRKFERQKIEYNAKNLDLLIKHLGYKSISKFFEDVGSDRLNLAEINFKDVFAPTKTDFIQQQQYTQQKKELNKLNYVLDSNIRMERLDYKIAKCCNPSPGEQVIVLRTRSGLVLHKTTCKIAKNYIQKYPKDRYFLATWLPITKKIKLLKVRFKSKSGDLDIQKIKNNLKKNNFPIYRIRLFHYKPKKQLKGFIITKQLGEKQRLELKELLKNLGCSKINFAIVYEQVNQ